MKQNPLRASNVSARRTSSCILVSLLVLLSPCQGSPTTDQSSPTLPDTREEVIRLYGEPTGAVVVGAKEILTYPERKVLLNGGKVTCIIPSASPHSESAFKNLRYLRPPRGSFRLGYDPNVWVFQRTNRAETDRFMRAIRHVSGEVQLMFNTENTSFAGHDLADIVIQRIQANDPSAIIKKKELRRIKGGQVTYLRIRALYQGLLNEMDFYIHSSPKGTAQVIIAGTPEAMTAYAADVASIANGLEILSVNTPEIPEVEPVTFKGPDSELSFAYDPRDWMPAFNETKPARNGFKFVRGDLYTVTEKFPPGLGLDAVIKLLEKRFGDAEKMTLFLNRNTISARGGQLHGGRLLTAPGADQRCYYIYLHDNPNGVDAVIFMALQADYSRYFQHIQQIINTMTITSSDRNKP